MTEEEESLVQEVSALPLAAFVFSFGEEGRQVPILWCWQSHRAPGEGVVVEVDPLERQPLKFRIKIVVA